MEVTTKRPLHEVIAGSILITANGLRGPDKAVREAIIASKLADLRDGKMKEAHATQVAGLLADLPSRLDNLGCLRLANVVREVICDLKSRKDEAPSDKAKQDSSITRGALTALELQDFGGAPAATAHPPQQFD